MYDDTKSYIDTVCQVVRSFRHWPASAYLHRFPSCLETPDRTRTFFFFFFGTSNSVFLVTHQLGLGESQNENKKTPRLFTKATQTMKHAASISHPMLRCVFYIWVLISNLRVLPESFAFRVLLRVQNEEKTKCPRCRDSNPRIAFFMLRKATADDWNSRSSGAARSAVDGSGCTTEIFRSISLGISSRISASIKTFLLFLPCQRLNITHYHPPSSSCTL